VYFPKEKESARDHVDTQYSHIPMLHMSEGKKKRPNKIQILTPNLPNDKDVVLKRRFEVMRFEMSVGRVNRRLNFYSSTTTTPGILCEIHL